MDIWCKSGRHWHCHLIFHYAVLSWRVCYGAQESGIHSTQSGGVWVCVFIAYKDQFQKYWCILFYVRHLTLLRNRCPFLYWFLSVYLLTYSRSVDFSPLSLWRFSFSFSPWQSLSSLNLTSVCLISATSSHLPPGQSRWTFMIGIEMGGKFSHSLSLTFSFIHFQLQIESHKCHTLFCLGAVILVLLLGIRTDGGLHPPGTRWLMNQKQLAGSQLSGKEVREMSADRSTDSFSFSLTVGSFYGLLWQTCKINLSFFRKSGLVLLLSINFRIHWKFSWCFYESPKLPNPYRNVRKVKINVCLAVSSIVYLVWQSHQAFERWFCFVFSGHHGKEF